MPVDQSDRSGVLPTPDQNAPIPPVPEDHKPKTPEFLTKLISERDALQQEKDAAWAKYYGPPSQMTRETKPNFMERLEWERLDEELSGKIAGLTTEINELRILIPRQSPADQSSG